MAVNRRTHRNVPAPSGSNAQSTKATTVTTVVIASSSEAMPESYLCASQNIRLATRKPTQNTVPEPRSPSPPSRSPRLNSAPRASTKDATMSVECQMGGLPAPGGTESVRAMTRAAASAQ